MFADITSVFVGVAKATATDCSLAHLARVNKATENLCGEVLPVDAVAAWEDLALTVCTCDLLGKLPMTLDPEFSYRMATLQTFFKPTKGTALAATTMGVCAAGLACIAPVVELNKPGLLTPPSSRKLIPRGTC